MERKAPPPLPLKQQPQPPPKNGIPARRPPPQQQPRPVIPTSTTPLSPGEVIALVREARKKAAADDENRATADSDSLKPGITLDLIGKNIPALPDEVVDILKNGVERQLGSQNT